MTVYLIMLKKNQLKKIMKLLKRNLKEEKMNGLKNIIKNGAGIGLFIN